MILKISKRFSISILMMVFFISLGNAQQANDQYGFGARVFLIQSALETGKSADGFWDIPGTAGKTDGNFKGGKWLEMGVYQREKGDPVDRLFRFSAAQGSATGRYFIKVGRGGNWGLNYIEGKGKIEARSRSDHFEIKNVGGDRWKIYPKPGYVICLENNSAKNGTKLTVRPDNNSSASVWVFYDLATLQSFIPEITSSSVKSNSSYKGVLKDSINSKNPGTQYFEQADGSKFDSENANGALQSYLNTMRSTSDQWSAILNIVKAVKNNKDVTARRSMYKAISNADIKKGSNFLENVLKGKFSEQINDVAKSEKDSVSKNYITTIAGKIR